ncbi:uncharacterized protein LOC118487551 [Helianthus annuus]|uniref:uncharacterized protein LOC118487551 n=1 Tax=Helianthus annuus TaxID=4232 RepID=UPI001653306D|nr:uncharacterized protein LOC118487551 [Helianthus annuus]
MDSIFQLSGCTPEQQVPYVSELFADETRLWWNLQIRIMGATAAYVLTWGELKGMMHKKYCSQMETQRWEGEFRSLMREGPKVLEYVQRLHDLSRVVPYLVKPEMKELGQFIWELAPQVLSLMTTSTPPTTIAASKMGLALATEALRLEKLTNPTKKKETQVESSGKNKRKLTEDSRTDNDEQRTVRGPDRATVAVVSSNNENEQAENDEIKEYYDCRYISACEASWRIFSNEVNYRSPSVMRLPFHLPGQQTVYFGPDEDINHVLNKPSVNSSMVLSWMQRNQDPDDTVARTLTYVQFPRFYVWKLDQRIWVPRIKGKTIGRIHSVSPSTDEAYYLRILLNKVKGPTSFDDIKTVNGRVYDTFRDACYALGLLDDDSEYIEAIKEANISGSAGYIRNLFATMLLLSTLSRPEVVWESTWKYMTDDFLYRFSKYHRVSGLSIPDEQLKNYVLCEIEKFLTRNNSSLRRFVSMPYPDTSSLDNFRCRLINEELAYDRTDLQNVYQGQVNLLTDEQRSVYEEIMNAVDGDNGGVFFVYGYGGTGKTFLWKTLSAAIRSKGEIVLNVASSGIASLLLDGGRTTHSRFHIPLNLNEDSVCHIKPDDDVAKLLQQTKLIIWDEAPMVHKHAFEALDRTMHDIFNISNSSKSDVLFGGKVIIFGGDFRQILPVVPNGGRQEIVNASLCSSYLWRKCQLLTLTRNMRLTVGRSSFEVEEINNFAKWLLDVGEGNVDGSNDGEAIIEIPPEILIDNTSDPISSLIDFVYPSILENCNDRNYFSTRAILAPKNEVVHEINDRLLALFPGEEKEYLSSDSLCPTEDGNADQQKIYSPDVLNGLKVSGLPNHRLVLKVGVPVMLLRNIDQRNGLCNGTRLKVTKLYSRVIEAEIISGGNIGSRTFIPRMNLVPSDRKIPFAFQRRQFPITMSTLPVQLLFAKRHENIMKISLRKT